MDKREKILGKIIQFAKSKHPNSEIYLYGSRARGDAGKLSDWDLLILLNSKNISLDVEKKIMDEFYELELETGEVISPLVYSKMDWNNKHSSTPLYEKIKNEGIKLQ